METYQDIFSYIYDSLVQELSSYQTGKIGELVKENFNLSKEKIQVINPDSIVSEVFYQHKNQALILYYSLSFVIFSESNPFTIEDASKCIGCLIYIIQHTNQVNLQESVDNLVFSIIKSVINSKETNDLISWILKLREIAHLFQSYNSESDEALIRFRISSNLLELLKNRNKDSILNGLKDLAKLKKNGIFIENQENNFINLACEWIEETNDFYGLKEFIGQVIRSDIEGARIMLGIIKNFDMQGDTKEKVESFIEKYGFIPSEEEKNLDEFNVLPLVSNKKYLEIIGEPIYAWSRGPLTTSIHKGILRLPGLKDIKVAIKSISHPDKRELKRSEPEADFLKKLSRKHSAFPIFYGDFYDNIDQKHRYNIVMELFNKGNLYDDITERKAIRKLYTDNEYSKILITLLDSIAFLHTNNIFHRDLKPQNLLFNEAGEIKLIDFNVSEVMEMPTIDITSREESIRGTVNYMSPEIREAFNEASFGVERKPLTNLSKSDIYSLGLILLEMRTLGDIKDVNLKNDEARNKLRSLINEIRPIGQMNLKELIENMLKEDFKERISSKAALSYIYEGSTEAVV